MTDRLKGFIVTLDGDIREDDAETIKNAISMIKGVVAVSGSVVDSDDYFNRSKINSEVRQKLYNLIKELNI